MERIKSELHQSPAAVLVTEREDTTMRTAPLLRDESQFRQSAVATIAKSALTIGFTLVLVGVFCYLPPARAFQDESLARILPLHVPNSIVAALTSTLSALFALRYLMTRRWIDDVRSRSLASLSMLFWLLTTVTGAVFAKVQWGAYWNWDPKQAAIFVLLLLYLAYFVLRSSIGDPDTQARIAAAYILFATATVPFLTYILPNATPSLHPKGVLNTSGGMDMAYKLVVWSSVAAFCGLAAWMYNLHVRIARLMQAADARYSAMEAAK